MRQERFTEQAQEALALSQQLVRQYQHSQWDVEHILLALLQQEKDMLYIPLAMLILTNQLLASLIVAYTIRL